MKKKNYIYAERVEKKKSTSMMVFHNHPHYELYFLEKGTRQILFEDRLIEVQKNNLVIIPPYIFHKTEGDAYTRVNINISPSALSPFTEGILQNLNQKTLTLNDGSLPKITDVINQLIELSNSPDMDIDRNEKQIILLNYLIYLLSSEGMIVDAKLKTPASIPLLVLKILDYFNTHYNEHITLESLSKIFYTSTVTICTQFKKHTHYSVNTYLTNLRISKAQRLLATTNKSIEDIAYETGFSSANYFCIIFKKTIGITPTAFRHEEKDRDSATPTIYKKEE